MTNFKKAFYGLNKTDSNELNDIINDVDTLNDNIESYITETELNTALGDYTTSAVLTTTLADYALDTDLANYVETSTLTTTLTDYVTNSTLTTNLTNYAKIVSVPASATAVGNAGEIAYDATNIYVCVAANTWVKAALATWT